MEDNMQTRLRCITVQEIHLPPLSIKVKKALTFFIAEGALGAMQTILPRIQLIVISLPIKTKKMGLNRCFAHKYSLERLFC